MKDWRGRGRKSNVTSLANVTNRVGGRKVIRRVRGKAIIETRVNILGRDDIRCIILGRSGEDLERRTNSQIDRTRGRGLRSVRERITKTGVGTK